MEYDKTKRYTESDVKEMTNEDIQILEEEVARRAKSHKRFRWGLGIVGGLLLVGAAITIAPVGALAAFSTAWWAVNGALTSLGLIGIGSAIVARVFDRKNIANLKILRKEKELREGNLDQRTNENIQRSYVKSFEKGKKHLSNEVSSILGKNRPEVKETAKTQASQENEGPSL